MVYKTKLKIITVGKNTKFDTKLVTRFRMIFYTANCFVGIFEKFSQNLFIAVKGNSGILNILPNWFITNESSFALHS